MKVNAKSIDLAKVQAEAEESYRKGFFCCEAVMEVIMDNFELDVPHEIIKMASGICPPRRSGRCPRTAVANHPGHRRRCLG